MNLLQKHGVATNLVRLKDLSVEAGNLMVIDGKIEVNGQPVQVKSLHLHWYADDDVVTADLDLFPQKEP